MPISTVVNYCKNVGCPHLALDNTTLCVKCLIELNSVTGIVKERTGVPTKPKDELSGGDVNYYLLDIPEPKRLAPYKAECEDIIEALQMTFAEGNILKALWRSCNMRIHGHGKQGQDIEGTYDGDKIAYYGDRVKVQRRRKAKK